MTTKDKKIRPNTGRKISSILWGKEKSEQHNYHVEDKRKTARIEHTNGSTPSNKL